MKNTNTTEPSFFAHSDLGMRKRAQKKLGEVGYISSWVNLVGIFMLLFAIGFNLWIYRMEPTALSDPNDNTFQYALVERTNQVWEYANKTCKGFFVSRITCHVSLLVDHWVPNWAEGYNLPYYYSHIPQIVIVTTYRLFQITVSLFTYYHWVIYLLLCLFPLSMYVALRTIRVSPIAAGIGALIASHLSTDGLYGLDPTSFLWRGYGLSSQLFAMVWFPLALASAWNYFRSTQQLLKTAVVPILFLALTTAGHLGIGIIAFMSVGIIFLSNLRYLSHVNDLLNPIKKLLLIYGGVFLLLGYWILPILKDGSFHNISVWDGIWKFDSFGYREVLTNLINGDLFDFGRFPILTILVLMGLFSSLVTHYSSLGFLFIFWLLLYFGRTTWGGLFNLIPGMSEFHLSRFIVGIHIAGLFLIPISIDWLATTISSYIPRSRLFITLTLGIFVAVLAIPQTIRYATHNDFLIARGNTNFAKSDNDVAHLFFALRTLTTRNPGRVFAGRGGSWGKNFRIAETPMYMYLSTYGIPVVLWLPETWSPNSDTEQYFSEGNKAHYTLYNVSFVITPTDLAKEHIQPFWKLVETGETWKIYEVETDGYITTGVRPAIVSSDKENFRSVVRLWMHSDFPTQQLYPELTFDPTYPKTTGLPNFRMTDEANYIVPDGSRHNLFAENPHYVSALSKVSSLRNLKIISQSQKSDMIFRASVNVPADCTECIVILRQTYHPSWQATVDGKKGKPFAVFPFYTAIKIETAGKHDVVFSYEPSGIKKLLLFTSLLTLGMLAWFSIKSPLHT